ncbi:ABC transporter ATP-binding protein, partial [Vibrio campbellii]
VMNQGVIEQYGTASELYFEPSSKFVADFLGGGSYLPAERVADDVFATSLGNPEAKAQDSIAIGEACELLLRPQHIVITASEESKIEVLE